MCVLLVAKHYLDAHILVCTQSNSAADIYVKNIDTELEGIIIYMYTSHVLHNEY